MKKIAIVRGPNLNKWEMQNIYPLIKDFSFTCFASWNHNFDLTNFPLPIQKLPSIGQSLNAKILRRTLDPFYGDYHDLMGLEKHLEGFDIIHSAETSYYFTYQAAQAKMKYNSKLIVTVWENIPFLYNNSKVRKNKEFVFENTDLFLAVSERAKEVLILEGAPSEKIKIQVYGINTEHFKPMEKDTNLLQKFNCTKEDIIILFVANLYREKGIYDLLYAFKTILNRQNKNKHIRLLIGGKGKEQKNIQKIISELSLNDYVVMIGSYKYDEMPKIHNLADIFVLPSIPIPTWQEQFGYVLIESMACGKPVISTSCGSIPEVIGDAGIIIPSNDFKSLSEAILSLYTNPEKRLELSQRALKRAKTEFNAKYISNYFSEYYYDLLQK